MSVEVKAEWLKRKEAARRPPKTSITESIEEAVAITQ